MEEKKKFTIPRQLQRLQHAASVDDSRFNIRGVRFESDCVVATSGHVIAVLRYQPAFDTKDVPVDKTVRFNKPKLSTTDPDAYCPNCDSLVVDLDGESKHGADELYQVTDELLAAKDFTAEVLPENFPDWRTEHIFPEHKQPVQISINPRLLMKLANALDCDDKLILQIETAVGGDKAPILVVPTDGNGSCLGALMPMNRDHCASIDFAKLRRTILAPPVVAEPAPMCEMSVDNLPEK